MIRPMMSFAVVINGPVARAGSISRFSRARGMNVPKSAANTITHIRLRLTVMLRLAPNPSNIVVAKMIVEQMRPLNSPTLSSLARRPIMLLVLRFEAASPCTTIAETVLPHYHPWLR